MGQVDLALRREFRFKDRKVIQVRLEAFNVLNQANFADPVKYLEQRRIRPIDLDVEPDAGHRQSRAADCRRFCKPADRDRCRQRCASGFDSVINSREAQ